MCDWPKGVCGDPLPFQNPGEKKIFFFTVCKIIILDFFRTRIGCANGAGIISHLVPTKTAPNFYMKRYLIEGPWLGDHSPLRICIHTNSPGFYLCFSSQMSHGLLRAAQLSPEIIFDFNFHLHLLFSPPLPRRI